MKSFALHLVVVLIVGFQYHPSAATNATTSSSSSSSSTTSAAAVAVTAATTTTRPPSLPSPPSPSGGDGLASLATTPTPMLVAAHTNRQSFNVSSGGRSGRSYSGGGTRLAVNGNNNNNSTVLELQQKRQHHRFHLKSEVHPSPSAALSAQQTQTQTTKTPRMIQRLVAGHLQHRISPNDVETTSTPFRPLFRKRTYQLSSSYRKANNTTWESSTTVAIPKKQEEDDEDDDDDDHSSDEAFLESPQENDNWDNGILRLSAGAGKESQLKSKKTAADDSKKTLSDQVRDGKYGLIEKELFRKTPKRPGVISYLPNKEVPADNDRNYGGLDEEDIWLAEDHLLVIKGGGLNERDTNEPWPPLDDYEAPDRQIKIPANPKVPPPFPVQFEENGPIQIIGDHQFPFIYTLANESAALPAGAEGYRPAAPAGDDASHLPARPGSAEDVARRRRPNGYLYPAAYPPWLVNNETKPLNGAVSLPAIGPFPFAINGSSLDTFNGTDYFDEDDPSLYYPPPYSFVYRSNYSNPVPPGPLVPGIVLPPPPNAFARLERVKNRPSTTTETPFREILTKISEYTPKTIIVTPVPQIPRTSPATTTIPPTTTSAPPSTVQIQKQIVYAVTKPPLYSTPRPQTSISFVPQTPSADTFSKSNPIYYEYFDATTPTPKPPQRLPKPTKAYKIKPATVAAVPIHPNRIPPAPARQYAYDDYVYITPKPDVRPPPYLLKPSYKASKPIESFEQEVDAIRQTLQFFKNKHHYQEENNIPQRAPKAPKPIFEFAYDASKSANFHPSPQYDEEPFKPMVTYSPLVDDANSFKAIAYSKADGYYSSTAAPPARQKKVRLGGAKYLAPIVFEPQATVRPPPAQNYRTILTTTQQPWVSIEKQPVQQVRPAQKLRVPPGGGFSRNYENGQFTGYNYNAPPIRQNNRYYDEPFHQPQRLQGIINQYQPQYPVPPAQQQWSLENDTYVNYGPNRPPVDPNSEYIQPYPGQNQYRSQAAQRLQVAPPQPPPIYIPNRSQPPPSLYRDTLVNYRHPLPPINPDSEFIAHPQVINSHQRQLAAAAAGGGGGYRPSVQYRAQPLSQQPQQPLAHHQHHHQQPASNIYYIGPKYKRNNK